MARSGVIATLVAILAFSIAPCSAQPLRALADARDLYIGAAVSIPALDSPEYAALLVQQYNVVVAENAFKWNNIHPAPDTYNFAEADRLVALARSAGMAVRGHTLIWDQDAPAWLDLPGVTQQQAITAMRSHIYRVVGRYRGQIAAWDVVNEAIDDATMAPRTNSVWYRLIGPDYIAMAFRFAHEADPEAVLYYNDTRTEDLGPKSDAVFELVSGLLAEGVPVHGVGWQMHVENGFRTTVDHRANAARLAALGLELTITELDVRILLPASEAALEVQAETYANVMEFCLDEASCRGVLTWGFTDRFSWIPTFIPGWGAGLPFDENYRPKPAYEALRDRLLNG